MDFNPDAWGTVADWVGSVGTTLAFAATFVVIRRDARVRRVAQARKVVLLIDYVMPETGFDKTKKYGGEKQRFVIKNLSDEPIYDVTARRPPRNGGTVAASKLALMPGEQIEVIQENDDGLLRVAFEDNSGQAWLRMPQGRILPLKDIRREWGEF